MGQLAVRALDHLHLRIREVPLDWGEVVHEAIEAIREDRDA